MNRHLVIAGLLVFFVGIGTFVARRFPPLSPDEVIVMVNADSVLHGHGIRYSLNHDIYPSTIQALSDLSNHIARPLYDGYVALWMSLVGRDYRWVRLSAIASGAFMLLALYTIGLTWRDRRLGILLVGCCLANPIFLASSLVINEHSLLGALGVVLLAWLIRFPLRTFWNLFFWGAANSVLLYVHQNGLVINAGLFLVSFLLSGSGNRLRASLLILAGYAAGNLVWIHWVDLPRILLFQRAIYWNFCKPPLLSWPWHPWAWLVSALKIVGLGPTYYFWYHATLPLGAWKLAQILFWMAASLALAAAWTPRPRRPQDILRIRTLMGAAGLSFGLMSALVRRPEAFYALALFPFLLPVIGLALEQVLERIPLLFMANLTLLAMSIGVFSSFTWSYAQHCRPWGDIVSDVQNRIPHEKVNVAGPSVLWSAWSASPYRDIDGAVTARYYVDQSLDHLLSIWRPEIVITESSFDQLYHLDGESPKRFSELVGQPVRSLGTVKGGNAYGDFHLYAIDWSRHPAQ